MTFPGTGPTDLSATLPVDAWFTARRFAVLLAFMIMAVFPEVIFGNRTFVYFDFGSFGYPLAFYHRECFWRGEVPLWNPLSCSGIPFFAQWITLVSYPLSLFYLLFPLSWSLGVFCLLHLFLAGLGMYLLARRWTASSFAAAAAGVAFAFNGLTLNALMWPNLIAALAWMPLVVLAAERAWREGGKHLFIGALAGGMQMLTGAPEIILFTWFVLVFLSVAEWTRERALRKLLPLRFSALVALVSALAAVQLLPFLDLLRHSHRDAHFGDADWSMPLTGWANFLVPLFRCHPAITGVYYQAHQGWTSSYYLGIGLLAFGVLAFWTDRKCRVWLLGALTLISLLLAMGDEGLVLAGIRRILPEIGFMRFPIKFVVIAIFTIPLLAAFSIKSLFGRAAENRTARSRLVILVGAVFSALVIVVVGISRFYPVQGEQCPVTLGNGLSRLLFLNCILGISLFAHRVTRPLEQIGARFLLLLLLWLDVATHAPWQNPTAHRSVYQPGLSEFQKMIPRPKPGESRLALGFDVMKSFSDKMLADPQQDFLARRLVLLLNLNLLEAIPKTDGFFPLNLREERDIPHQLFADTNRLQSPLADFLGISQVTAPGKVFEWQTRPSRLPLITVGQQPSFVDDLASLRGLLAADFDPRQTVFLPLEAGQEVRAGRSSTARILSHKFSAQRIAVEMEASEPAMLVVAQAYYHWWQAYVDGARVPLWRANHAFQAVAVPGGRHHIDLVYEDGGFVLGAIISLSALALCLGAWLGFRRAEVKIDSLEKGIDIGNAQTKSDCMNATQKEFSLRRGT